MRIGAIKIFREGITRKEKYTALLVYFLWSMPLLTFVRVVISKLPLVGVLSDGFIPFCLALLIIASIGNISKKISERDVFAWMIICVLYLIQILVFPRSNEYQYSYIVPFLITGIPYLFIGEIIDYESEKDALSLISVGVVIAYFVYVTFYQQSDAGSMTDQGKGEGMSQAYLVMPHVMMVLAAAFRTHKLPYIFVSVLGVFFILSLGTRGALLYTAIFAALYFLFLSRNKYKLLYVFLILLLGVVTYNMFFEIMFFLQGAIEDLGMSTRIVDRLLGDTEASITSDSGRGSIQAAVLAATMESPWFGKGFCGSFLIVGTYPHNLFFELLCSFGVIIGSLISIWIVYIIISAFRMALNNDERVFLLVLVMAGFAKLMTSYTFLDNFETYLMLGYCLQIIRRPKYKKRLYPQTAHI